MEHELSFSRLKTAMPDNALICLLNLKSRNEGKRQRYEDRAIQEVMIEFRLEHKNALVRLYLFLVTTSDFR